jgi:drug/metabolite transporter (DMT)-like permease
VLDCASAAADPSTETSPAIGAPRIALLVTHASLLLTAMLWGGNFAALRFLLDELRPLDVVFLRGAGAAFFFALALLLTGRPRLAMPRRDLLRLIGIGLLGVTVVNLAVAYGQARLPAALASLIVTSNPIHTALISRVLLGEPLGPRKLAGIGVAFAGLAVVLLWGSGNAAALGTRQLTGVGILAIAPFAWAFYTVLSKPLLAAYPSVHVAAYTTIAGAALFLPLPLVQEGMLGRIGGMDGRGWLAAVFTTLISFVLAYLLWYRGLRVLTPSQTAVYIYLVPVFGLLAAWLVLGERPTLFLLLGGATILAGVILTNSAPRDRRPSASEVPRQGRAAAR